MNDPRQVQIAQVMLGREAQEFLASDVGRYLLGRAEQDKREAQDLLSRVAPWRKNRIRQLQNEVWRAESFVTWLAELINEGAVAEVTLLEDND